VIGLVRKTFIMGTSPRSVTMLERAAGREVPGAPAAATLPQGAGKRERAQPARSGVT
jgi:hypothetical protein